MMKHIRPWQLFQHLNGRRREVLYTIPSHKGTDSETIMALETMCLVAVARMVEADTILEFGTSMGYNAHHLAANLSVTSIATVDKEERPRVWCDTRIKPVIADIFDYDPVRADMVFCDINYTPETLRRCTDLAFASLPKVIGWHDYGHPLLPHVKPFLDELAESCDLIHVEDSSLVLWFRGGLKI